MEHLVRPRCILHDPAPLREYGLVRFLELLELVPHLPPQEVVLLAVQYDRDVGEAAPFDDDPQVPVFDRL